MAELVREHNDVVVLVGVGEFDVARLALDVEVAFVAVVKAVGKREAVALVDTPAHTDFGTDVGEVLPVVRCATVVYVVRRRIERVGKLDARVEPQRLGRHGPGRLQAVAHGEVDGVLLVGVDGVGTAVHEEPLAQGEFPVIDFDLPREVEERAVAQILVGVVPTLVAIEFERVAEGEVQVGNGGIVERQRGVGAGECRGGRAAKAGAHLLVHGQAETVVERVLVGSRETQFGNLLGGGLVADNLLGFCRCRQQEKSD